MLFFSFIVKQAICTLLLILIFNVSAAYSQNTNPTANSKNNRDIKASIVLILDSSFSMRLTYDSDNPKINGLSRMERAKIFLRGFLKSESKNSIEWALVTFGEDIGRGRDVALKIPFTRNYRSILNYTEHLKAWGLSPFNSALTFGINYCIASAKGEKKIVIVISDSISTDTKTLLPSEERIVKSLKRGLVDLYLIGFPIPGNKQLKHIAGKEDLSINLKTKDHFHFYDISQLKNVTQKISKSISSFVPDKKLKNNIPHKPDTVSTSIKRINPLFILFLFLLITLIVSFLYFSFLRKRKKTEKVPVGTRPFINLKIISSSGKKELKRLHKVPVQIAEKGNADILLSDAGFTGKLERIFLRIEYFNNIPFIRSNFPLNINGVARKQKKLKEGDHILFGRYRIYFLGAGRENVYEVRRKKPFSIYAVHAAGLFFLIVLILILGIKPVITKNKINEQIQRNPAITSIPKATERPPKYNIKTIHPAKLIRERIPIEKIVYSKPRMYKPGDKIDYFKADILFFHAHPDDESLDFGCLMAQGSRAGKKVVTVLFTDGESGLDRYPERVVNSKYPKHDLKGRNLASVRTEEAENAMSILGSQVYIRLGLKNHPYNSIKQVMSKEAVFKDWGGEDKLIKRVIKIIKGFHPDVIVAPDLHTGAYEHFEHEAVGYIVRKAVLKINNIDNSFIKGYIVSVDPLQYEVYPKRISIDAMEMDPKLGIPYRLIQREALEQHITQRDASVIGVEILPNFQYEYYEVEKWDIPRSLETT